MNKNILEIDGHKAVISFDSDLAMFRGEFLGLNGGADFYAESVTGLIKEGRKSLKVFLALCEEKGLAPFREYSGKFNVRLSPSIHEAAATYAAAANKSLNEWVSDAIERAIEAD